MHMKPSFITFTGADENTDIERMRELSVQYPIEWGILFSHKLQGGVDFRYPGLYYVERFIKSGLNLSAHLCGKYARGAIEGEGENGALLNSLYHDDGIDLAVFNRIQINHGSPSAYAAGKYAWQHNARVILQTREQSYPTEKNVDWLYDASGGRGKTPEAWPAYPNRLVGFAGGMNPDNVAESLDNIAASGPYWIDMESGVRTDGWFDLDKVARVCEKVYN